MRVGEAIHDANAARRRLMEAWRRDRRGAGSVVHEVWLRVRVRVRVAERGRRVGGRGR